MSAKEESSTEATALVTASITVTTGFDEDGDPAVWVLSEGCSSLPEALGMLEVAKMHRIREATGA